MLSLLRYWQRHLDWRLRFPKSWVAFWSGKTGKPTRWREAFAREWQQTRNCFGLHQLPARESLSSSGLHRVIVVKLCAVSKYAQCGPIDLWVKSDSFAHVKLCLIGLSGFVLTDLQRAHLSCIAAVSVAAPWSRSSHCCCCCYCWYCFTHPASQ